MRCKSSTIFALFCLFSDYRLQKYFKDISVLLKFQKYVLCIIKFLKILKNPMYKISKSVKVMLENTWIFRDIFRIPFIDITIGFPTVISRVCGNTRFWTCVKRLQINLTFFWRRIREFPTLLNQAEMFYFQLFFVITAVCEVFWGASAKISRSKTLHHGTLTGG